MSAKIMGRVWDYQLSPSDQAILLAIADHADHNGENAYPSVRLLAWKTGLSRRGVFYSIKRLRAMGALVEQRKARFHYSTTYRIVLNSLPRKAPLPREDDDERGATAAPLRGAVDDMRGATDDMRGAKALHPNRPSNHPDEPVARARGDQGRPWTPERVLKRMEPAEATRVRSFERRVRRERGSA